MIEVQNNTSTCCIKHLQVHIAFQTAQHPVSVHYIPRGTNIKTHCHRITAVTDHKFTTLHRYWHKIKIPVYSVNTTHETRYWKLAQVTTKFVGLFAETQKVSKREGGGEAAVCMCALTERRARLNWRENYWLPADGQHEVLFASCAGRRRS